LFVLFVYERARVLFVLFVFASCCLWEGWCLVCVVCLCLLLFMRGFVFGSCCLLVLVSCFCCLYLPPVVYERARVLFMLFMRGLVSCLCCLSLGGKYKQHKQDTSTNKQQEAKTNPLINNRRQRQTTQTRHQPSHKQQEAKTNNTNKTRALS
jgi:hypothetical protein